MMNKGFFITGTDTAVGKTSFSVALIHHLQSQGNSVSALKPVASGCEKLEGIWKNDDALKLLQALNAAPQYETVNPVALPDAIAPHLAAKKQNIELKAQDIFQSCQSVLNQQNDYCIVEGAGGWLVPLNNKETMADLAILFNFPVVIVVSMKLGCMNHCLLTVESIKKSGLKIAGWVANVFDPEMEKLQENIATVEGLLTAPLLATMTQNNESLIECRWMHFNDK